MQALLSTLGVRHREASPQMGCKTKDTKPTCDIQDISSPIHFWPTHWILKHPLGDLTSWKLTHNLNRDLVKQANAQGGFWEFWAEWEVAHLLGLLNWQVMWDGHVKRREVTNKGRNMSRDMACPNTRLYVLSPGWRDAEGSETDCQNGEASWVKERVPT